MKSIATKIFMPLVTVFVLLFLIDTYFTYTKFKQRFTNNAHMRAVELKDYILSARKHYQKVFLENQTILTKNSIKLLPAHASLRIDNLFQNTKSGNNIQIRTVSDNPRNKENQADKLELDAIDYFKQNKDKKEFFKDTIENGKEIFQYAYALKINKLCLKCHGKKEQAPKIIQELYNQSYDYKLGETRGIVSIKINKDTYNKTTTFLRNKIIISFGVIFIVLVLLYFLVVRKVSNNINSFGYSLHSFFDFLSGKSENIENIIIDTDDEIGKLSKEINENIEVAKELHVEKENNHQKEKQLLEASKKIQMGEMIGNIAHQWRQPLSVISTAASGLQIKQEYGMLKEKDIPEFADAIIENANFLSKTIDTFSDFVNEKQRLEEVILQERIDVVLNITNATLKNHNIKLINEIDYDKPIKIVKVVGELSQVIINILNNSKDVVVENKIENPWIKLNFIQEKQKVIITIEDNGGGISPDIMPKIFDPYFTTKHQSQGAGLGLHSSYKIITESLKGKLYVSNTKSGAKFFIEIPLP